MILAFHLLWQWLGLPHWYLSTGCRHGEHTYCQADRGHAGTKVPAVCKFCRAQCRCRCHRGHRWCRRTERKS
jgi:hypothetical protein